VTGAAELYLTAGHVFFLVLVPVYGFWRLKREWRDAAIPRPPLRALGVTLAGFAAGALSWMFQGTFLMAIGLYALLGLLALGSMMALSVLSTWRPKKDGRLLWYPLVVLALSAGYLFFAVAVYMMEGGRN
jgi:hypothetical protein